jgi:anti-anti-sigma factor
MMEMARISIEDRAHLRLATVDGEVDASNAEDVKAQLLANLPNAAHGLLADLRGLEYLDSSGIAVLFELADRLDRRGQKLAIAVGPESLVRPTLELTGVSGIAFVGATVEEAEAGIKPAAA